MYLNVGAISGGLVRAAWLAAAAIVLLTAAPADAATPLSGATAVSTGGSHACAIVNGGVKCWGDNDTLQLGTDAVSASPIAIDVEGLPAGSGVTAISAGYGHTCAIVNGGVRCWGRNAEGQLGRWTGGLSSHEALEMALLPAGSGVMAIAAGQFFTCAVLNGGVQCWGFMNAVNAIFNETPTDIVPPGSGATHVAGGFEHACAAVDGGVRCWGWNVAFQLGDGTTTDSQTPVQTIPAGSGATKVAAGYANSCAIVNGAVQCWGMNAAGGPPPYDTVPEAVLGLPTPVGAITSGEGATCAVANGGAFCWGLNLWGALGRGSFDVDDSTDTPGAVFGLGPESGVTGIDSRLGYVCAVVNGGVRCWGLNYFGTLGNGDDENSAVPVSVLVDDPTVNTAPTVGPVMLSPSAVVAVEAVVAATASVTDPDVGDTLECLVSWGDGASDIMSPQNDACGSGHVYLTPGVYMVTIAATDAAGASDSASAYVAVYDPSAAFVTGGGWFASPAGAYAADPTLTGRASFGFSARYRKGRNVPEGHTEFQFQAAGLTFRSTTYDWLVVAGHKAMFRGTGLVNNSDRYAFQLTVTDGDKAGQPDGIRVRIWDAESGAVVYDNQTCGSTDPSADACVALGGGEIVIR